MSSFEYEYDRDNDNDGTVFDIHPLTSQEEQAHYPPLKIASPPAASCRG
jgi:hypothetical protein